MVQHLFRIGERCIKWRMILVALFAALSMSLVKFQPAYAQTPVNCADTATTGVTQAECETLIALYNSTNGPGWTNKTNWNTATAVGTWYGVTVTDGHVTELTLNVNQLSGSLPDLSVLAQLKTLSLTHNGISGNIPDLSALTQLETLDLFINQLSGPIPDLSALTQLKRLSLGENQLSGNFPDLSALTQLETLGLFANQLNGPIPDLSRLTQLRSLHLYGNQFSGSFPNLSALTQLQNLYLSYNQLSGPIPDLSTLTQLKWLYLNDNQFSGNIPDLSALVQLQRIILSNNQLTGTIPDFSSLAQLEQLILDHNQLSGAIPDLAAFPRLWYLVLDHNQLSGTIPNLSIVPRLAYVDLSYNQLSGTIPDLSGLTQLAEFSLGNNQLVSLIPPSVKSAFAYHYSLSLCGGNNIISSPDPTVVYWVGLKDTGWTQGCGLGTVPMAVADPAYTTDMNGNFTVDAPGVLTNDTLGIPAGYITSFGGGSLGGAVTDHAAGTTVNPLPGYSNGSLQVNADGSFVFTPPTGFSGNYTFQYRLNNGVGASDAMVTINVSHFCANTTLTGVPQAECEALVALYTSTNGPGWTNKTNWNTATAVSSWYGVTVNDSHVIRLYLYSNQLDGNISDLSTLTQLRELELAANQLNGTIPDLSALTMLQYLYLDRNQLSGPIPDLSTLTNLKELDLYQNQLSGLIPNLSSLTQLQDVDLNSNQLSGSIPDLSALTELLTLNLSSNQLSGAIPNLSTLTKLMALALSSNQLSGAIPDLSALTKLQMLILDHNQLVSFIPPSITSTAIINPEWLSLCGGGNIIASPDPTVVAWVRARDVGWTQGCSRGTAPEPADDLDYAAQPDTTLTVDAPGILANDTLGTPDGIVIYFGGRSLGGAVTDHVPGTTISPLPDHTGGSLTVNADGSFVFTPPTPFTSPYRFEYLLSNGVGRVSARLVTISLDGLCADTTTTGVPQAECEALVALYNSTNGPNWWYDTNWNTPTNVDTWYGVTVSGGHVTELLLENIRLSGSLSDLSALTQLQTLTLSDNEIGGSIPDLSALTQLQSLKLDDNELNGTIPDLSALIHLKYLWLDGNQLSGSIPDLSALTELQELVLYHNQLSGSIPDVTALNQLTALVLYSNQLTGSIPDLSALTQLRYLYLGSNQLTGGIPDLSPLTQLEYLSLEFNAFSGSIPDLSDLNKLVIIHLNNNQLSGNIPNLLAFTELRELYLNNNQLTGSIPDLSALTHLWYLYLDHNQLTGSIPDLSALTSLGYLHLDYNQLTSNIPDLSLCTRLWEVRLNNNQLSGNIPDLPAFGPLSELSLNNNQLSGSIPDLSTLTNLARLNLSNNQLVSLIPTSVTDGWIVSLCGGDNIISSPDPVVIAWMQEHDTSWTQGCGQGTAPTAAADPSYITDMNTTLAMSAPGVLTNDTVGIPGGIVTFFGVGSLGGTVTDHAAGTTVSPLPTYSDGSLQVNADGSFSFTPPANFKGTYTFQYRLNNGIGASDSTVTIVVGSTLRIDNVSGFESNTGTITFTVTRTDAIGTSTVQFATADGTATAGSDYVAASDTLTFDDGVTTRTIEIALIGDAVIEGDETFFINLSNPTNATIVDAQGEGTITNSTVALKQPANHALTRDNTPVFVWKAVSGAVKYRLQVDNNRDFTSPVFQCAGPATQCTAAVLSDARYYWRLQARDAAGNWGNWSTPFVVTVDATPPARPVLLAPANNVTTPDSTPFFRWNAVSGAVVYQLQVDDQGNFTSPATNITQAAASYTQPRRLADKRYYWRVRAQDKAGNWSAWSPRWSFVVNAIPMAQPTLIPTNTPRPTLVPTNTPVPTATLIPTEIPTATPTATMTENVPHLQVVEAEQPIVSQSGIWTAYGEPSASGAMYLLSSTPTDSLNLAFIGSEVTVVYIKHPAVGSFAIEVDGVVMQVVDSVATEAVFGAEATISGLGYGQHTVKVYPTAGVVAIDAFRVETPVEAIIPTPIPTDIPTDIPADTPIPTDSPTDSPVETPVPTDSQIDIPMETPVPTETPIPTETPTEALTSTPSPTEMPTPSETPSEEVPSPDATEAPTS